MTTIVLAGVAILLVLSALLVKARARKPKRADKWEKAQIMKRLLALSEREDMVNGVSLQPSSTKRPAPRTHATAKQGALSR